MAARVSRKSHHRPEPFLSWPCCSHSFRLTSPPGNVQSFCAGEVMINRDNRRDTRSIQPLPTIPLPRRSLQCASLPAASFEAPLSCLRARPKHQDLRRSARAAESPSLYNHDPLSQHKGRVVQLCRRKVLDSRGSGCFCRIARRAELGEMTVGFRFRKRIRLGKGIWRLTFARERLAQRRRQRARHEHQ